jgi:hypothetical protein
MVKLNALEVAVIAVIVLFALRSVVLNFFARRDTPDWQPCFRFFPVRLIDGSVSNRLLMRRWIGGAWQYRKLTPAEAEQEFNDRAW